MESQIYLLPITFPLWGIFLGIAGVALLALEVGYLLGRRRQRRGKTDVHEEPRAMSGALLGFLAFVLAIVFGNQSGRFDSYRQVATDEANAIQKAWFDAEWIPSPHRENIRASLEEYTESRIEGLRADEFDRVTSDADRLHDQMWNQLRVAGRGGEDDKPIGQLAQSIAHIRSLHNTRLAIGVLERIHPVAWSTLITLMVLAMGSMGYNAGINGSRRTGIRVILVVSFSLLVTVIADINKPEVGWISVDQRALEHVRKRMPLQP
jgi:hypothetical protein